MGSACATNATCNLTDPLHLTPDLANPRRLGSLAKPHRFPEAYLALVLVLVLEHLRPAGAYPEPVHAAASQSTT